MRYNVQFFQVKEFICPCCKKGLVSVYLVYFLDMIRRAWGGPVQINSAWRCPKHNAQVGGAKQSRHLIGCAADIAPVYQTDLLVEFKRLIRDMTKYREGWEIIEYPWGMHVAVPRSETMNLWDGNGIQVIVH